jgi:hypothetical protein
MGWGAEVGDEYGARWQISVYGDSGIPKLRLRFEAIRGEGGTGEEIRGIEVLQNRQWVTGRKAEETSTQEEENAWSEERAVRSPYHVIQQP